MIRVLLFALLFAVPAAADNVFMDNTTSESNMCVIGITGQTTSNPAAVARATYSPITYTCSPGKYLPADGIECVACTYGNYCPGGDHTYNETTDQGINPCPDPQTHQRTTFNTTTSTKNGKTVTVTYDNPTITSTGFESSTTRKTITDCLVSVNIDTTEGHLYEFDTYNPTTQQYDLLTNFPGWTAANAGYYLTSKWDCAQNAYYGEVVQCPAGSYCPGVTGLVSVRCDSDPATYWPENKGLYACPSSYPSSDVGTSSQDYCYRACTTSDVAHATSVTGHYYYNDNNQCEPTSNGCSPGYHYTDAFDPSTDSITIPGTSGEYHSNDDENITSNGASLPIGGWAVTWNSGDKRGTLSGIASCNTEWGTPFVTTVPSNSMNTSNTGKNCWCKATSWTTYGGYPQSLIADWVLRGAFGNSSEWCANGCVSDCANNGVKSIPEFRSAVFNAIRFGLAQCDANTITIDWSGYGAGNNQTQQTQCTYGGSITTPTDAPTKRGHVFVGWTFDLGN